MKLVFFGSGDFGLPALEALASSGHTMFGVVTAPDKPKGRKLIPTPTPVKEWALTHKQPVMTCGSKDALKSLVPALQKLDADCFIVVDFGVLLPKEILGIPKKYCLNIHPSLLPRYRGAAPVEYALLGGDAETGISIVRMTEALDAGDILLQKKIAIARSDDAQTLYPKLSQSAGHALLEALALLEANQARWTLQDSAKASFAKKLKKTDGRIDWNLDAQTLCNRIRAFALWPVCYTFYEEKRLLIARAEILPKSSRHPAVPGTVLEASAEKGISVATQTDPLRILELQLEGKKRLSAREFLKGFSLKTGRML